MKLGVVRKGKVHNLRFIRNERVELIKINRDLYSQVNKLYSSEQKSLMLKFVSFKLVIKVLI